MLALPGYYLYTARSTLNPPDLPTVVQNYVKAVYARNFKEAYRWLSTQDRRTKDEETYVQERGAFDGFTARLAARLAGFIESAPLQTNLTGNQATVKLKFTVPDAEKLSAQLLGWDKERLNSLPVEEQNTLLQMIDRWRQEGKIPLAQVEESFALVKEGRQWKVLLNWQDGVRIHILTKLPPSAPLEVEALPKEIVFQPGEPFLVTLKVKNRSNREVWARVAHTVEPEIIAKYMGLADCGAFIPFRLAPGQEQENRATFLVWTDVPDEMKRFTMVYQFEVD